MRKNVVKELLISIVACDNCEKEIGEPRVKIKILISYNEKWNDFGEWVFCSEECFYKFLKSPKISNIIEMIAHEKQVADVRVCLVFENPETTLLQDFIQKINWRK